MTEYINIIQNKSVNIYKNMLCNYSESHNILFSKGGKKTTGQKSSKFGICFKCPVKADICSLCGPEGGRWLMLWCLWGQRTPKKPANCKPDRLEVALICYIN